jgi:hypothetical protein
MRGLLCRLIGIAALALAVPASAQSDVPAELAAAAAAAEARGQQMYLYDQAAWHATDRFVAEFDLNNSSFMRGYIVLPRDDGMLDTVFFGEIDGALVEVARYRVEGSEVVAGGVLEAVDRPPLSLLAVRMADARQTALNHASEQEFGLCADARPNTVVLPPDGSGNIAVYILTPQVSNEAYPLGGHFRVDIDPDGKVAASRRFLNSCFMLQMPRAEGGNSPVAMVVSHLLDPQPTEIHMFVSRYFGLPIYVGTTANDLLWKVSAGQIGPVQQIESRDRRRAS